MKKWAIICASVVTLISLVPISISCGTQQNPTSTGKGEDTMSFMLKSTAFVAGESIPYKYTCDGADVSPPLEWSGIPRGTASFALVADDPDALGGTWVHWVLYNIPSEKRSLAEALQTQAEFPDGSKHGKNSAGHLGYNGPCPPEGEHRYFFKLYALDTVLNLGPGASKEQLLSAMKGHILEQAELMGKFKR
jgi:Raf kinase inhibitor-like YbhB/YbcL family protein